MLVSRRGILRGLFAAPAIVAASSLMPIRGAALVMRDEFDPAEIAATLDQRIDAGDGHWCSIELRWKDLEYPGDGAWVRYAGYDVLTPEMFAR